jgi:hypothetical protein
MTCATAEPSSLTSIDFDRLHLSPDDASWDVMAACRELDAPSMFADDWGVGRSGRRHRAAALAVCRRCAVSRECGLRALAEVEEGLCLYGVRAGIEFTDVTPSRQQRDVERLRAVVQDRQPSIGRRPALSVARQAVESRAILEIRRNVHTSASVTDSFPDHPSAATAIDRDEELLLQAV